MKDSKKIEKDPKASYCPGCGHYLTSDLNQIHRCEGRTEWGKVTGYRENIISTFASGKTMMVFTKQVSITGAMPGYGPMPSLTIPTPVRIS